MGSSETECRRFGEQECGVLEWRGGLSRWYIRYIVTKAYLPMDCERGRVTYRIRGGGAELVHC